MEDSPAGKKTSGNTFVESPKKTPNPVTNQSQWSFGWQANNKDAYNRANNSKGTSPSILGFNLYHNSSSILLGEEKGNFKKEEPAKKADMRKKDPITEKPVWNYNPKTAGKTTMVLGSEKTDYRKKDEVYKERTPTALTKSRKKWCPIYDYSHLHI